MRYRIIESAGLLGHNITVLIEYLVLLDLRLRLAGGGEVILDVCHAAISMKLGPPLEARRRACKS